MMRWFTITQFVDEVGPRHLATVGALRWEIAQHSRDLVMSGVLILGAGRRPHLLRQDFEEVALSLLSARQAAEVA